MGTKSGIQNWSTQKSLPSSLSSPPPSLGELDLDENNWSYTDIVYRMGPIFPEIISFLGKIDFFHSLIFPQKYTFSREFHRNFEGKKLKNF